MDAKTIKSALIRQRENNLSGNLYYKTQIDFAYNTNHIEGSTITPDETESIYETGTILTSKDKVIVVRDVTETKNHFTLFLCIVSSVSLACLVYAGLLKIGEMLFGISIQHEAGYICAMLFIILGFPFITSGIDLAKLDMRSGTERLMYALIVILVATMAAWLMALILHL